MTVDPPVTSLHAPDSLPDRRFRSDTARDRAMPWDASRRQDLGPKATAFAAQIARDDVAERFDARAIVAPVGKPDAMSAAKRIALAPTTTAAPNDAVKPDLKGAVITALLERVTGGDTSPLPTPSAPRAHVAPTDGGKQIGPQSAPLATQPTTRPTGDAQSAKSTRPAAQATSRPAPANLTHGATARIVAFADEVRIVIRGAELTADDSAALVRVAEDTLAGTPFAGRPVRVITNQGKA